MSDSSCIADFPDEIGIYKVVTCFLFAVATLSLVLIHYLCPAHVQIFGTARKNCNSHVIDIDGRETCVYNTKNGRSKYGNGYTSILRSEADKNRAGVLNLSPRSTLKVPFDHTQNWSSLQNVDANSRNRSASLNVQFKLDSNKNNGFTNIGTQGAGKNSVSFQSFNQPPSYHPAYINYDTTPVLKRSSSSQELATFYKQQSTQSLSAYNSMPNVNQQAAIMPNILPYDLSSQPYYGNERVVRDFDESLDEGEMQCTVSFDRARYLLIMDTLAIQTILPAGAPGFVVEVTLLPKHFEVVRSKVYVTKQPEIDITLNEPFYLKCDEFDLANCSMVITVKPILSHVIFFAETDLNSLDLARNGQMYLGGFLKGVYTSMRS